MKNVTTLAGVFPFTFVLKYDIRRTDIPDLYEYS